MTDHSKALYIPQEETRSTFDPPLARPFFRGFTLLTALSPLVVFASAPLSVRAEIGPMSQLTDLSSMNIDAFNGVTCIPDCGRYFREGQAEFETEVLQLQDLSAEDSAPILTIESDFSEIRQDWLQELESNNPYERS